MGHGDEYLKVCVARISGGSCSSINTALQRRRSAEAVLFRIVPLFAVGL